MAEAIGSLPPMGETHIEFLSSALAVAGISRVNQEMGDIFMPFKLFKIWRKISSASRLEENYCIPSRINIKSLNSLCIYLSVALNLV